MIFYKNTAGKEIHLDELPFSVDVTALAGFDFNYNTNLYTNRNGGSVSGFSIGVIERNITVGICADPKGIEEALNEIIYVTQYDIQRNVPGKLYIGNSYILCNLIGSAVNTFFDPEIEYVEKNYKLVISYPFWCTEKTFEFFPKESNTTEGLDYPYDYPFDYYDDSAAAEILLNDHYADSDFQMVIYGPVVNPKITIGGHVYGVTATLNDGEYILIDSRTNKVRKTSVYGEITNLFNYRDKDHDLFKKIPAGSNSVIFGRTFGFSITLFQERSEPRWNIS